MSTEKEINETKVSLLLKNTPTYAYYLMCQMEGASFKWKSSVQFINYYKNLDENDPKRLALEELADKRLTKANYKTECNEIAKKYKDEPTATREEVKEEIQNQVEVAKEQTPKEEPKEKPKASKPGYENIDYACQTEKPAGSYAKLEEIAYKDFAKGEGNILQAYIDASGNPTIGCGHLIFPKSDLGNAKKMQAWRSSYINKFPQSERALRAQEFDAMASACRNGTLRAKSGCPRIITSPATRPITEKQSREIFNSDFKYWYNRTKEKIPYIDDIPVSAQLTVIHCAFGGSLDRCATGCKDPSSFPKIIKNIRDVRGAKTSEGTRRTMNDSIKVCNDSIPGCNIPPAVRVFKKGTNTKKR